jgi:hypothetical protein
LALNPFAGNTFGDQPILAMASDVGDIDLRVVARKIGLPTHWIVEHDACDPNYSILYAPKRSLLAATRFWSYGTFFGRLLCQPKLAQTAPF